MNENVLVFVGIIVGVAVSDQLSSLHRLLRQRELVRWDWLLLWMAALVLLTLIQVWWSLASMPAGRVTIGAFLPGVVLLILLFLLSAASLPDSDDPNRLDLPAYYQRQSRYIWTLFTLALVWLTTTSAVQRATSGQLSIVGLAPELLVIAVMASMAVLRRRWWHAVGLALLTWTGPIGWLTRSLG